VLCLATWTGSAAAESACLQQSGVNRIAWTELALQAKKFTATLNARIRLTSIFAADIDPVLPKSPRGTPVQPSGSELCRLELNMRIHATLRSDVQIFNQVWFNPGTAEVVGRVRLRRGQDDFKKIYRFTRQGVFRHRWEPLNKKELLLKPEKWTDVKDSFYAYALPPLGCSRASERLALLYILSTANWSETSKPLSLCVFGKRQLHRVTLRAQGLYPLQVDYLEKTLQSQVRRNGLVRALKIAVETQPLDSTLKADEDFSLMGLHKEIIIYIDPVLRIPLQISGNTPAAGRMDLKLRQVQLTK
jgi:hypothetical protein